MKVGGRVVGVLLSAAARETPTLFHQRQPDSPRLLAALALGGAPVVLVFEGVADAAATAGAGA